MKYKFYIQSRSKYIDYKAVKIDFIDNECIVEDPGSGLNHWNFDFGGLLRNIFAQNEKENEMKIIAVQYSNEDEYYCAYEISANRKDEHGRPISITLIFKTSDRDDIEKIYSYIKNRENIDEYFLDIVQEPEQDTSDTFFVDTKLLKEEFGPLCMKNIPDSGEDNEGEIEGYCYNKSEESLLAGFCEKKNIRNFWTRLVIVLVITSISLWVVLRKPETTSVRKYLASNSTVPIDKNTTILASSKKNATVKKGNDETTRGSQSGQLNDINESTPIKTEHNKTLPAIAEWNATVEKDDNKTMVESHPDRHNIVNNDAIIKSDHNNTSKTSTEENATINKDENGTLSDKTVISSSNQGD